METPLMFPVPLAPPTRPPTYHRPPELEPVAQRLAAFGPVYDTEYGLTASCPVHRWRGNNVAITTSGTTPTVLCFETGHLIDFTETAP